MIGDGRAADDPLLRGLAGAFRVKLGVSAILAAIGSAVALPWIVGHLAKGHRQADLDPESLWAIVRWAMANPYLMLVLCLPAVAGGAAALVSRRSGLLFGVFALLWASACVLLVVVVIVGSLAPMYRYEDLG